MSDPAVTAFLTKLLCSHGGRLERDRLGDLLDLPAEQIEQILQEESLRFPQCSQVVLAQSPLRVCTRHLFQNDPEGKEKEDEETCPKLHLCRYYLRGNCTLHQRLHCKFTHDIHSDHNRAVLKANELSGLNEDEIKVLLFQNDYQLLPEDCPKYVHGNCDNEEDCKRLHMCRFFTGEGCNRRICKRSHNLLESKIILNCRWMSKETVQNFQMLCMLKHNKRLQEPWKETTNTEAREAQRMARGRGRGRGRGRKRGKGRGRSRDASQDPLDGRGKEKNDGPSLQSSSRPLSQCSSGQRSGEEDDDSPSDSENHSTYSEKSDDYVTLPCHTTLPSRPVYKKTNPTAAMIRPQPTAFIGCHNAYCPPAAEPPKVLVPPLIIPIYSPMGASLQTEARPRSDNVFPKPVATSNITQTSSVKMSSVPYQKPIIEFGKTASSLLPVPAYIYPTSSSTSKTSVYSPRDPSNFRVPPLIIPIYSSMGASLQTEARHRSDNVFPKPAAASSIKQTSSVKMSSVPDQKPIVEFGKTASSLLPGPANIPPTSSSTSKPSLYSPREISNTTKLKQVSGSDNPYRPPAAEPSKVPVTPSTIPVNSSMEASLKTEARLNSDNAFSKPAAASNITENLSSSVKMSSVPDKKTMTEFSKMTSVSMPGPANIPPTSSSTSKTSLYSTREISSTTLLKQVSGSGNPYCPPAAEPSKVPATSSTTTVTFPMGAASSSADIVSPKPSAASNITENLSTKGSSIPDQKLTMEHGKTERSSVPGPGNHLPTSSSASKTSSYLTGEVLYTAQPKPVTSIGTVPLYSSSSPSNTLSSPTGSSRADAPSNKLYATVEQIAKSNVASGRQYTAAINENKAFNLPAKSTNSTAPQPQPATNNPSASVRKVSVDKTPEICLSNIWKYCNFGDRCNDMHYYLPYRWQELKGTDWVDLPNIEDIEMAYSDPINVRYQYINFQTMTMGTRRVRRLTTPSSVTRSSEFVLTTEWVWFWKDEFGTWIKYGESNKKKVSSSIYSSDLENIYLSDPTGSTQFSAGGQNYIINFKEMKQRNIHYQTEKEVCRRPKFLDFENVKMLRGSTKSAADSSARKSSDSLLKTVNYPSLWDTKAMPETGYQKVPVLENSGEFSSIVKMFSKTVSGHMVKKLWRVQNPSLWQIYQWQKDQMMKKNSGINVDERQLFHGTDTSNIDAICRDNFDWRVCGTNGIVYGQGSYFARDASYSHNYTLKNNSVVTRTMFMARVLVGDFVVGDSSMRRPPLKCNGTQSYDSCVDNIRHPSIFVVFEKLQIYPEYILEYEEEKKSSCVIS